MLFPNDPTTLEPLDFADAYRPADAEVVTLADGRQAIPLLLVIDPHVGKSYAASEFPAIFYMTDGVKNRAHAIQPALPTAPVTAVSAEPPSSELAASEPPEPPAASAPEPVVGDAAPVETAPVEAIPVAAPEPAPTEATAPPSAELAAPVEPVADASTAEA